MLEERHPLLDPVHSTHPFTRGSALSDNGAATLPQKPKKSKTGIVVGAIIAAVVVVVAIVLVIVNLTAPKSNAATGDRVTVRIGTTEGSADYWPVLKKLAAKKGIDIKVVNFSDYTQANPALSQKQIDLNLFQHLLFLANYDVSNHDDLTPIASTLVVPLPLYSDKYTSVDDIPKGATIAIPNDATNQARALLVLQEAGLITLKNGGSVLSTPADIDQSASRVTVAPVDASQTAAALASAAGAIVNNNFALDAKLDPKSALFQDDPKKAAAEPYINAFVARAADKDNPTYLTIAKLYKEAQVTDQVLAESKNTAVLVDRPQSELESILKKLETTVKDAQ